MRKFAVTYFALVCCVAVAHAAILVPIAEIAADALAGVGERVAGDVVSRVAGRVVQKGAGNVVKDTANKVTDAVKGGSGSGGGSGGGGNSTKSELKCFKLGNEEWATDDKHACGKVAVNGIKGSAVKAPKGGSAHPSGSAPPSNVAPAHCEQDNSLCVPKAVGSAQACPKSGECFCAESVCHCLRKVDKNNEDCVFESAESGSGKEAQHNKKGKGHASKKQHESKKENHGKH